ncbi:relaxase domain-containing protein [Cyanobacteria bacterium FACHB-63]|nr:relaxase domain-containing protein [Cyanobacteria bacterium FACHB-63]
MLTISKLGAHTYRYFIGQCQTTDVENNETFDPTVSGERPGIWLGQGASVLGLPKDVRPKTLNLLLQGFDQYGEKLVTNAGYLNHTPGWGLAFAAPKSVSLVWALSPALMQTKIDDLHLKAVQKAISYLESVTISRRGKSGIERSSAQLVVAAFTHSTNQANEVHLHTHALAINAGIGQEFTGAIESKVLYRHQKAAGAIYRSEFAASLEAELGLSIARVGDSFEIEPFARSKGRYQSLMNSLSSRRVEIERYEPKTPAEAERISRATRTPGKELKSQQQVINATGELAARYGITPQHIERLSSPSRGYGRITSKWAEWKTMKEARTEVVRYQSHFSERDLVFHLAKAAQGRGITADRVLHLAEKILLSPYIRGIGQEREERRYTTQRIYQQEKALMASIAKISLGSISVRAKAIEQVIEKSKLSLVQKDALRQLCDRSSGLKVLSGLSGSGKSEVAAALSQVLVRSGYRVTYLSHSRQSAQRLEECAPSHRSLFSSNASPTHLSVGQFIWEIEQQRLSMPRSSVVIVDDAHRLSLTQISTLAALVERTGAKLVFSGDIKVQQFSGAFKAIATKYAPVELTELHRQAKECDQAFVQAMADGKALEALKDLAQRNQLTLSSSRSEAIKTTVNQWVMRATHDLKNHVLISDSAENVRDLNVGAQAALKQQGVLQGTSLQSGLLNVYVGDRIQFTQNQRLDDIYRGDRATVLKLNRIMRSATVELDNGDRRVISLKDSTGIELGYAVRPTQVNAAPRYAHVLTEAISKEQTLAQVTQFRECLYLNTWRNGDPLMRDLVRSLQYEREQKLAIEVARNQSQNYD